MPTLKIATYNIHKGLSQFNRRVVLHELRERLRELDADIVFLQEVQGEHTRHGERYPNYQSGAQHEFIAEKIWPHTAYGKNSVYEAGHHGNAILSRFPILQSLNTDVSAHRFESRGLLHCEIELAGGPNQTDTRVHCLCVHFGLFARGQRAQMQALIEYVRAEIPAGAALIIAGDFNDWRNRMSQTLSGELGLHDVFHLHRGNPARSFPSRLPMLRLDRIYVRGFDVLHGSVHVGGDWRRLSDHVALSASLKRHDPVDGMSAGSLCAHQVDAHQANGHQVDGEQLQLLKNGAAYFPQLCADIDAAQHSIYLETYIFAADETGRRVADALQRAAARGLVVRVLLDGYGSAELPQDWVNELRAAKVEVQWFRREISPFTLRRNRMRRLLRLHRKLAVMDGEVAFVTGINICNDMPEDNASGLPRLDYAVRVQGVMAGEIQAAIRHLWGVVSWANFRRRGKEIKQFFLVRAKRAITPNITLLLRDNLRHRHDIEAAYLKAITGAQREIIIANAYFLPGRTFRLALIQAAQRGIRVVLLLQGRVEYRLQHYATHALYDPLLAAGVEIYEYQPSYLHAKVAVVDGQWATVGSSNIDPFSLLLAREANLAVRDAGFAGELRASLFAAIADGAVRIGDGYDVPRSWTDRLAGRISYGIVRLLIGLLGYGKSI